MCFSLPQWIVSTTIVCTHDARNYNHMCSVLAKKAYPYDTYPVENVYIQYIHPFHLLSTTNN